MLLSTDLKQVVVRHMDKMTPGELAELIQSMCSREPIINLPVAREKILQQFQKLDANGVVLPRTAPDWSVTKDLETGLLWTRRPVTKERLPYSEAMEAASKVDLLGRKDWRASTVKERLSIVDYERYNPAINTDFFEMYDGWEWTSTPAAYAPEDCAWFVSFSDGRADWSGRGLSGFVRAVCPSQ